MKTFFPFAGAVALAVMHCPLALATTIANTETSSPHVLVIYDHPDKFIYSADSHVGTEKERESILAMFREYIEQRAGALLPDGHGLYITFNRIDFDAAAPRIEAVESRIGNVVGATTVGGTPMFDFGWAITNRSGTVLRKGRALLTPEPIGFVELNGEFLKRDPFYYDKSVLDDWLRNNARI